jgi:hypothetical protein
MRIYLSACGDYKVTSTMPFAPSDILSVAHKIARQSDDIIFDWPVTIEENHGLWVMWLINPVPSDNYLDFEELV